MFGRTKIFVHLLVISLICIEKASLEIYSSLEKLADLVDTNEEVIKHLRTFIDGQYIKIKKAEKIFEKFGQIAKEAKPNPKSFMGNPINSFIMVKHLTVDLNSFIDIFDSKSARNEILDNLNKSMYLIPSEHDYFSAAESLMRIEDTYKLSPSNIRKGDFDGFKSFRPLNAYECFEFGRIAHLIGNHYHAIRWLTEARNLNEHEEYYGSAINKTMLIQYLSNSTFQYGNIKQAIDLLKELLLKDPENAKLKEDLETYKRALADKLAQKFAQINDTDIIDLNILFPNQVSRPKARFETYESLCRGDFSNIKNMSKSSQLKCRYVSHHPYLKIGPVKEELVLDDPPIWVYYDVLTEKQASIMINLSKPKLAIARTQFRLEKVRISQNTTSSVFSVLDSLIEAITNLSMKTAEPWQMNNYGLGGLYYEHYDPLLNLTEDYLKHFNGNRIATWMYYIEAPDVGGATAFPNIGARIQPVNRSAVFWYNLLPSGKIDKKLLHAACPVLVGSKWVSNKWIHEYGQEFRRPCNLSDDLDQ